MPFLFGPSAELGSHWVEAVTSNLTLKYAYYKDMRPDYARLSWRIRSHMKSSGKDDWPDRQH